MWRGFCSSDISVFALFVWRCLSGSTLLGFHIPLQPDGRLSCLRVVSSLADDSFCRVDPGNFTPHRSGG
jgi:hypothetical protein